MAIGQTRVNGGSLPFEAAGRDLKWVLVASTGVDTNSSTVGSNLELITYALMQYGTITIAGTAASGNVRFAMEGLAANATVLTTACNVITGNTPVVTVTDGMSGATFA